MAEGTHLHHEIDNVKFEVINMAEARRVYEAAFDWTFNDYGPGYAGSRKSGGSEAGGFGCRRESRRPVRW